MAALSYVRGPDAPILEITIGDAIAGVARRFPDRDALISRHQKVRLSWRAFDQAIDRTARGLAGLGLRPKDRVGIWSANCVEWVVLQIACARAGLVLVNVNPACRSYDLRFVLKKSRVLAWIRLAAGASASEEEIRRFCVERIAHFKIPQHIRFVESFPATISGKIQKFRIREIEMANREWERKADTR